MSTIWEYELLEHIHPDDVAEKIAMIEAGGNEIPDEVMLEAIKKGHEEIKKICEFISKIKEEIGKPKFEYKSFAVEQEIYDYVAENFSTEMKEAQEKPQEVISDESEQVEIPEIRMRDVKDVSASSYLSEKNIKHVPDRIMDGDTTTAWVEGVEGNGEGESITFTFGDLYVVSDIKIWNGYQKSEDLYYKNARTSELELEFSDGSTERISFQSKLLKSACHIL